MTEQANHAASVDPIRIGKIAYTNVWPIFWNFPPSELDVSCHIITQTPALINHELIAGSLDIAVISSFAYAQHADKLLILPNLSISSKHAVGSVLLFSKRPLTDSLPQTIALSSSSATSVHLLQIIMQKKLANIPQYVSMHPDLNSMLQACDAALLIGDDAIRASLNPAFNSLHLTDLAQLWKEWTGFGMTFALWVVREDWAKRNAEKLMMMYNTLLAAKDHIYPLSEAILDEAIRQVGGSRSYWQSYYQQLNYDFTLTEQQGLRQYFALAHELGFLGRVPELRFWQHPY
jgi:chorismate dehydratase